MLLHGSIVARHCTAVARRSATWAFVAGAVKQLGALMMNAPRTVARMDNMAMTPAVYDPRSPAGWR